MLTWSDKLYSQTEWFISQFDMARMVSMMCSLGLPWNMKVAWKYHISFDDGNLLLHYACQWKLSLTLIKLMEWVWPNALHLHSIWCLLSLHHACQYGCTDDIIKFLMESWPKALQIRTEYESVPLHYTCHGNCCCWPFKLVKAWSKAVHVCNIQNFSTLYHACQKGCEDETISFLVNLYPESLQIDINYGLLLLHCAFRGGLSSKGIQP